MGSQCIGTPTVQSAATMSTHQPLSELKFLQIVKLFSETVLWEPDRIIAYLMATRRRTNHMSSNILPMSFWNSQKLKSWATSQRSDIAFVTGNYRSRQALRNFCIGIIDQLRSSQVPVLLAINIPDVEIQSSNVSLSDILKYIIRQAFQQSRKPQTEASAARICAPLYGDVSQDDWFQLLASTLAETNELVYIVIDLALLDERYGSRNGYTWIISFLRIFNTLSNRGLSHHIKILFLSYNSELPHTVFSGDYSDFIISGKVKGDVGGERKSRGGRPTTYDLGMNRTRAAALRRL
jgi:hypothetical protein